MVNTVEYELILYAFLVFLDMVLGTYAHIFITKDSCSKDAKAGALKKLVVLIFMSACVGVYDMDNIIGFDQSLVSSNVVVSVKSIVVAIVAYMCYFEFVSVAANFALVTGVDLTKIPGVANELNKKKGGQ